MNDPAIDEAERKALRILRAVQALTLIQSSYAWLKAMVENPNQPQYLMGDWYSDEVFDVGDGTNPIPGFKPIPEPMPSILSMDQPSPFDLSTRITACYVRDSFDSCLLKVVFSNPSNETSQYVQAIESAIVCKDASIARRCRADPRGLTVDSRSLWILEDYLPIRDAVDTWIAALEFQISKLELAHKLNLHKYRLCTRDLDDIIREDFGADIPPPPADTQPAPQSPPTSSPTPTSESPVAHETDPDPFVPLAWYQKAAKCGSEKQMRVWIREGLTQHVEWYQAEDGNRTYHVRLGAINRLMMHQKRIETPLAIESINKNSPKYQKLDA